MKFLWVTMTVEELPWEPSDTYFQGIGDVLPWIWIRPHGPGDQFKFNRDGGID